jgi:hypothetical protein
MPAEQRLVKAATFRPRLSGGLAIVALGLGLLATPPAPQSPIRQHRRRPQAARGKPPTRCSPRWVAAATTSSTTRSS